ncbi:MAG: hypothetical protein ABH823_01155 [bacterium]
MNWLKAILYGIVLFAIMFLIGSVVMFGLKLAGTTMSIVMMIAGVLVVYLLAKQYKVASLNEGLKIVIVWLVVNSLLVTLFLF